MTRWTYHSANLYGNLHVAAESISKDHPEWDVVTMERSGFATVVVYRLPVEEGPLPPEKLDEFEPSLLYRVRQALLHSTHPEAGELYDELGH